MIDSSRVQNSRREGREYSQWGALHEGSSSRGLHAGEEGEQGAVHFLQLAAQLHVALLPWAAGTTHLPHLRPYTHTTRLPLCSQT